MGSVFWSKLISAAVNRCLVGGCEPTLNHLPGGGLTGGARMPAPLLGGAGGGLVCEGWRSACHVSSVSPGYLFRERECCRITVGAREFCGTRPRRRDAANQ